ncbi:MAG: hypothetical protein WCF93_01140 [Candidatus Moraniibacteriota bacterium]
MWDSFAVKGNGKMGYVAIGLDSNSKMLEYLKRKASDEGKERSN